MENQDYINKWLEGTLSDEEMRMFEKTEDFKNLQVLSKSLMAFKAPEYDADAEYQRLRSRMSSSGKVVKMNWLNPVLKIAAILTVLTGSYLFFLYDSETVVKTLAAEKTELRLPDSSFVALNALSKLSFSENKWKNDRRVELEGEAFFKVTKGSKFEVETSAGTVSVLGTAFNVKNRKDYFEVVCYEGSVKVESSKEVAKLLPGQMFRVLDGIAVNQTVAEENGPGWQADESSFKSVPFSHVIREFERQYNVSVTTSKVNTRQVFTGTFTHNDMSLALKSITIPLNLTYQIADDKKIVITGDIQ
jgi:ferric-dicitrate binding protein FerR (iron transport regulator)